jgi:hypothetical protein
MLLLVCVTPFGSSNADDYGPNLAFSMTSFPMLLSTFLRSSVTRVYILIANYSNNITPRVTKFNFIKYMRNVNLFKNVERESMIQLSAKYACNLSNS